MCKRQVQRGHIQAESASLKGRASEKNTGRYERRVKSARLSAPCQESQQTEKIHSGEGDFEVWLHSEITYDEKNETTSRTYHGSLVSAVFLSPRAYCDS